MYTEWDIFFAQKVKEIFSGDKNDVVLDIGGGLRILKNKGNRFDRNREWVLPLLANVQYKIMDPVPDYAPDVVGDIHKMPFADNTLASVICLAVLEHVEDPVLAMKEIYRTLKPGGTALIYVPFLFYYHAEEGYYKDYWRFTEDGVRHLGKKFSSIEIQKVRGRFATWIHLSPFGRNKIIATLANFLDRFTGGLQSRQVSGFNVFLKK